VTVLLLASTSDNSPAGQNFTLWFPAGLFIIVTAILYLMYSRPHQRVPPRRPAHAQASGAGRASVTQASAAQTTAAALASAAPASSAEPAASASTDGAKEQPAEPGDAGTEATE
jgi:hypothetical protein